MEKKRKSRGDEEEAQKEKIVRLLDALKEAFDRSEAGEGEDDKARCWAEMKQIAGDIRFGRKLVERMKNRAGVWFEKIEKTEREIERLEGGARRRRAQERGSFA